MKRSACRKSPQNSTRVTQRGTCLRQVAGPHSRKKKEELARLFCRIFFWHRALRAHRRQHQTSTHLDQQELIHRSRSKMTIYTLSNKQKTSQQHYNIGKKERKEIVIRTEQQYCAILESVITKQNGLLLYFKNKRLFWWSILPHNVRISLLNRTYRSRPRTLFLQFIFIPRNRVTMRAELHNWFLQNVCTFKVIGRYCRCSSVRKISSPGQANPSEWSQMTATTKCQPYRTKLQSSRKGTQRNKPKA